jgi:hypothetical protein
MKDPSTDRGRGRPGRNHGDVIGVHDLASQALGDRVGPVREVATVEGEELAAAVLDGVGRAESSSTTCRSSCSFRARPSLTSSSSSTMAWAARGATTRGLGAMEISSLLLLVLHRGADLGDDIGAEPLGHGEQPVGDLARALDDERLRLNNLLRPHRDFDECVVARTHADSKIDRCRAVGRHRSTVGSGFGEGAHRNVLHGAVGHVRDEQNRGDHQRPARRVQEAHGVRIAPSPRYRLAHKLRVRAPERRRSFRRRRLRRWGAGDLVGRCRSTRTRSGRVAESRSAAARTLAGSGFRRGTGLIGWSVSAARRGAGLSG